MYIPSPSVALQIGETHYVITKWHLHPTDRIKTIIDLELGLLGKGPGRKAITGIVPELVRVILEMKHMNRESVPDVDLQQVIRPRLEAAAQADRKKTWDKFEQEARRVSFLINMMDHVMTAAYAERYRGGTGSGIKVSELPFTEDEDDKKLGKRLTGWISQGLESWLEQSKLVTKR